MSRRALGSLPLLHGLIGANASRPHPERKFTAREARYFVAAAVYEGCAKPILLRTAQRAVVLELRQSVSSAQVSDEKSTCTVTASYKE
eukprot:6208302-Pleurochrysis_carterae.AAC.1